MSTRIIAPVIPTKNTQFEQNKQRDIKAAWIWVIANIVVWGALISFSFIQVFPNRPPFESILAQWARFDFIHFSDIARLGYFPAPGTASTAAPLYAFFPGLPFLLYLGSLLQIPIVVTGLIVSFFAGLTATIFTARIADLYRPGIGLKAAAVFALAPSALFLYAPYTESLFLAFALGAWYFGMRNRWLLASMLAALSCTVRISGIFLTIALFLLWLSHRRTKKDRAMRVSWLYFSIPTVTVLLWMGYLWNKTGDPIAYQTAQKEYWGRFFKWPWDALSSTVTAYAPTGGYTPMAYAEIIAAAIGVITTALLLIKRMLPEAVFLAINLILLTTSTYFYSIPRAALLWWPLWIGIAYLFRTRPILFAVYLIASAIGMIYWCTLYWSGNWAG